jgi:hypothetical protein
MPTVGQILDSEIKAPFVAMPAIEASVILA